jgi:hypothetical protein
VGAFVACVYAGRRATWIGFVAAMTVGYLHGILRANIESTAGHFIFDAGAAGTYLALLMRRMTAREKNRVRTVMPWLGVLVGWPLLLFFVPQQTPMIQLVGLRGQSLFLGFLVIGALIESDELRKIALSLAILNLIALFFALLEAHFGVDRFYPRNAVDDIIYRSNDVFVNGTFEFRIPATFEHSASYATNMVASMPILLAALSIEVQAGWKRNLLIVATACSALGVFLAASRSEAAVLILMVLIVTVSGRIGNLPWYGWVAIIVAVGWTVASTPRMQRFLELKNTEYVKNRVSGSVNSDFFDVMMNYPLGNGLGGGGTSIPYFLRSELKDPVEIENEYGRIMLEEGIPGLVMWVGFFFWVFLQPAPRGTDEWYIGRWLALMYIFISVMTAPLGTGLLNAIPSTASLLFYCGWIAAPRNYAPAKPVRRRALATRAKQGGESFGSAIPEL